MSKSYRESIERSKSKTSRKKFMNREKELGNKPKDRIPLKEKRNQQKDKFDVDGWTNY